MPHLLEIAPTGRATCRACGGKIAGKEWRFGERLPNPYADEEGAEMTRWYHLACAAYRRPDALLETLPEAPPELPDRARLEAEAQLGVAHRRVPRVSTADHAATARATCRHCKEPIAKGAWRIALLYYEDGRVMPSGFVHASCASGYFETTAIMPRLAHFSPALTAEDLQAIEGEIGRAYST